jgi:hypothetical protein
VLCERHKKTDARSTCVISNASGTSGSWIWTSLASEIRSRRNVLYNTVIVKQLESDDQDIQRRYGMNLLKVLKKERKEVLKRIESSKTHAEALLTAMHALKSAAGAAGRAYVNSLSRPKRKVSSAARAKMAAAQKARWAKVRKAQKVKQV